VGYKRHNVYIRRDNDEWLASWRKAKTGNADARLLTYQINHCIDAVRRSLEMCKAAGAPHDPPDFG
jgi:hypothetical protein